MAVKLSAVLQARLEAESADENWPWSMSAATRALLVDAFGGKTAAEVRALFLQEWVEPPRERPLPPMTDRDAARRDPYLHGAYERRRDRLIRGL